MKPIYTFFFIASILLFSNKSSAQKWIWARQSTFLGPNPDFSIAGTRGMASGINGDLFTVNDLAGFNNNFIYFGPFMIPLNKHFCAINRYDSSGNLRWVKTPYGIPRTLSAENVATDMEDNVFVSGYFTDTAYFDTYRIIDSTTFGNYYLVKYDSAGNVRWIKTSADSNSNRIRYLQTDKQGNVYYTGAFMMNQYVLDKDTLTNATAFLPGFLNHFDLFIAKFDTSGKVVWAKSAGGIGDEYPTAVTMDKYKDSYVAGTFTSPVFNLGTYSFSASPSATTNTFLVKYDSVGNVKWAKQYKDIYIDGLAADSSGLLYISGHFTADTVVFDTKQLVNSSHDTSDILIAAYTNDVFAWVKSYGTRKYESPYACNMTLDALGKPWVCITISADTVVLDKDTIIVPHGPTSIVKDFQVALLQFGSQGDIECSVALPRGGGNEHYRALTADDRGYVYFGASFVGDHIGDQFYLGTADTLVATGDEDIFIAKLQPCKMPARTSVNNPANTSDLVIYPNPAYDRFTIQYSGAINNNAKIELYNISGTLMYSASITNEKTVISTSGLAAGMYICKLVQDGYEPAYKKLMIIH